MRTRSRPKLALLAALAAAPRPALADRRYYGETYNAATAPRGALDVELWSTFQRAPAGGTDAFVHQLELETGITDRWDVALYNVLLQDRGDSPRYQALKVETRYRLSDPGQWFVDPILYLEVKKEFIEDRPFGIEEKVILGKDVGPLNLSLNLSAEQEFVDAGTEREWAYAFGTSYELAAPVRLGAEVFGAVTDLPGGAPRESAHYAGPALSVATGRVWLVAAAGFGLTSESDRLHLRAILAFQF
jgi:hypothetical protein